MQKPAAFQEEIDHIKGLGGEIIWPVMTKEITEKGIIAEDGRLIPGDEVIITIGESPDLSYLPSDVAKFRAWLAPKADQSIMDGVFAVGDTIKPGLLVSAIASGNSAADAVEAYFKGEPYTAPAREEIPAKKLHTAYFAKYEKGGLPCARDDFARCVSCGTCRDCKTCEMSAPKRLSAAWSTRTEALNTFPIRSAALAAASAPASARAVSGRSVRTMSSRINIIKTNR